MDDGIAARLMDVHCIVRECCNAAKSCEFIWMMESRLTAPITT